MIDLRVQFSLVPMVGDAFWAFVPGFMATCCHAKPLLAVPNMAVLAWSQNACAIFSNMLDFAVYKRTMTRCMPSRRLWQLNKPLAYTPMDDILRMSRGYFLRFVQGDQRPISTKGRGGGILYQFDCVHQPLWVI